MISEDLIRRVRGEFYEMPGLRLTFAQACRLWQLDAPTCEAVLAKLVSERMLHRSSDGRYLALPFPRSARSTARRIAS
jgi:hypothetical protein